MRNLLTICFCILAFSGYSQWNGNSTIQYFTGSVGVGTATPSFKFHIRGGNANSNQMTLGTTTTGNFALTSSDGGAYGLFAGVSGTGNSWLQVGRYDNNSAYDLLLQASGGKVGIGTVTPLSKLHISQGLNDVGEQLRLTRGTGSVRFAQGGDKDNLYLYNSDASKTYMFWKENGFVGVGVSNPEFQLQIPSNTQFSTGNTYIESPAEPDNNYVRSNFGSNVYWNSTSNLWTVGTIGANDFCAMVHTNGGSLAFFSAPSTGNTVKTFTNGQFSAFERMRIDASGNVGIGTSDPKGYKLAVAGKMISEEVVVKLQGNWPDYVFEKNYNLPTLTELEAYIKVNKHLPEVPSACAVEENGVNLSEMNAILLKKVEELTLYVIELKKENEEIKKVIKEISEK